MTACGQDRPRIAAPPADLLACAAEPKAPALSAFDWTSVETARAVQRQRDQATIDFELGLRAAGGDCRAKVAAIRAWVARVGQ